MQLAADTPRTSLLLRRCSGRFLRMDSKMCLSLTAALHFKKELNLKQANKFLLALVLVASRCVCRIALQGSLLWEIRAKKHFFFSPQGKASFKSLV